MLAYVPYIFEAYAALKPHLHTTMLHVVGYAGFTGECTASVRTLAVHTGKSKSTVSRHLAELVRAGALTRRRRPGGAYSYRVDPRFLPPAAKLSYEQAAVSREHAQAVPSGRTNRKPLTKINDSALPDEADKWRARLRSFRTTGFWLPQFGPKPTEPGCFAPAALLQAVMPGSS